MNAPCLFPTLRYQDADAAIRWLRDVLGFSNHAIYRDDDGKIMHAELALGSSILMLGQARDDDYGRMIGGVQSRRDAIYLAVPDIGPLHENAVKAGATIEMAPYATSYGSREFMCRDPEGNLWSVGTYWPTTKD